MTGLLGLTTPPIQPLFDQVHWLGTWLLRYIVYIGRGGRGSRDSDEMGFNGVKSGGLGYVVVGFVVS